MTESCWLLLLLLQQQGKLLPSTVNHSHACSVLTQIRPSHVDILGHTSLPQQPVVQVPLAVHPFSTFITPPTSSQPLLLTLLLCITALPICTYRSLQHGQQKQMPSV